MLKKVFLIFLIPILVVAQQPEKPNAVTIFEQIKKLNFLGSVLYIAAHPDDENTALISYFSKEVNARTAYLSLTRGDGGQNLIGPEIRASLGVIRTEELLRARAVDGGEQFFSRANDFGYSKHPDETLKIWDEDAVLSDVVWAIRKFQPDIIINRFSDKSNTFGSTHGHHSSSAILSSKAFDIAADKSKYPEQLKYVTVWQPKRSFFNTSWWFYGSKEKFDKADKSKMYPLEIGAYYPEYGLSNNEIAALSRSMHKSQGFGTTGNRGNYLEYLEFVKGDEITETQDLFYGINTTWSRVKGGNEVGILLKDVEEKYDFTNPSASIPKLIKAYKAIQKIDNAHWREQKTKEIELIIFSCLGLFAETVSDNQVASRGDVVAISLELINRSAIDVKLLGIEIPALGIKNHYEKRLDNNVGFLENFKGEVSNTAKISNPYWLNKPWTEGMYQVSEQLNRGLPNLPSEFMVKYSFEIEGEYFQLEKELTYKYNDPVAGEVYKPFSIIPKFTITTNDNVLVFSDDEPKKIEIKIHSETKKSTGKLVLDVPEGWKVTPEFVALNFENNELEKNVVFDVYPSKNESSGNIYPKYISNDGAVFSQELVHINYKHIPNKSVLFDSEIKVVKINIAKRGSLIGYIQGAGDEVPNSLKQIGYDVDILDENQITKTLLMKYDAIVLGIRVYNTSDFAQYYQNELHSYVNEGGVLIVQYNTNHRLKVTNVAPYPLALSKDRVTDENSKVKIIAPQHKVVNFPNIITQQDFKGWKQERGLYFSNKWSSDFTPILSMSDKGEKNKKGSLLIANYGNGYFIYTGLSFFRELPAGVPGAYRLFANMLSIGYDEK